MIADKSANRILACIDCNELAKMQDPFCSPPHQGKLIISPSSNLSDMH